MPEMDYSKNSPFSYREGLYLDDFVQPFALPVGQAIIDRRFVTTTSVVSGTQSLRLAYFDSLKTETVSQVRILTGSTGAAATPTLCRMGLYRVADNGDLTLIASTPNDTTLFSGVTVFYTKAFSAPVVVEQGQRYAFGVLVVTAVAAPNFCGHVGVASVSGIAPRSSALLAAQADLPSSILDSALANSGYTPYVEILP